MVPAGMSAGTTGNTAPEEFAAALKLLAEGRSEAALAILPPHDAARSADTGLLVARCLAARPDPGAALLAASDAAAAPGSATAKSQALQLTAELRCQLRQYRLAADIHQRILDAEHTPFQAFLLGRALMQHGWLDLAVSVLATARRAGFSRQVGLQARKQLEDARHHARSLLARRRSLNLAEFGRLARLLLHAGKVRGAEAAQRRLPPGLEAAWLQTVIAERRAWPAPRPAASPHLGEGAAKDLLVEIAAWALSGGELGLATSALALVPLDSLGTAGWKTRGALRMLCGEAAALAREVEPGVLGLSVMARAQLWLTGSIVSRNLPMLTVENVSVDKIASGDFPIVLYWHDAEPPPDVAAVMETWSQFHPTMRPLRFNRATARAYLAHRYGPDAREAFDACPHAAVEADLLRYAVLAREGGIWADADDRCLRSWAGVLSVLPPEGLCLTFASDFPFYAFSAPLAAKPFNPILEKAVRECVEALQRRARGQRFSIWSDSGPGLLSRLIAEEPSSCCFLHAGLTGQLLERANDLDYKRDDKANWRLA